MKTFTLASVVLLFAACSGSPTAPSVSTPLGATFSGSALNRLSGPCVPTVQAPESLSANQSSLGSSVDLYYTAKNGGDVVLEVQRLNAGSGLWETVRTWPEYAPYTYATFTPKNNATHRFRVRHAGDCNGLWSDWVAFGVEGLLDPEHTYTKKR